MQSTWRRVSVEQGPQNSEHRPPPIALGAEPLVTLRQADATRCEVIYDQGDVEGIANQQN